MVAAVLLLVLPPLLIAHPVAYVPLIAAVLLLVASWLYLRMMRKAITTYMGDMTGACERGQKAALQVELTNAAPLPCARLEIEFYVTDLFGDFDEVNTVACSLKARETTSIGFDVQFSHLGTYHAGISKVIIYDLLGLFSSTFKEGDRRQVVVKPREVTMGPASNLTAVPDESQRSLKPVAADDVDYAGVREYHFGDAMKTVHWNLSAREPNGSLYTRLFEIYVNPTLSVIIDPCATTTEKEELMSLFDGMVETAAALAIEARRVGIDADIRYLNRSGEPSVIRIATLTDAEELVANMMAVTPLEKAGKADVLVERMLREAGLRSQGSGNVALVTGRVDSAQLSVMTEIAMARRNAMVFVGVSRALNDRDRAKVLAPMGMVSSAGGKWWAVESNEVATQVVGY